MDASASRVNLLLKCGYWARKDVVAPSNVGGWSADYGIAVHYLTECHATGEVPDYDKVASEYGLDQWELGNAKNDAWSLYSWHMNKIGGTKYHELKVAYNTKTGSARALQSKIPRDYSECTDEEFPGTADLVSVKPDTVCVIDYKTGFTPWEIYIDQLNLLGLAASRIFGVKRSVNIVLKVSDGDCYPHHWVMEEKDLLEFERKFRSAHGKINGSDPTPGPHCTALYCPLAGTCPATLAKLSAEMNVPLDAIRQDGAINSVEEAQRVYEIKQLLTKTTKVVGASLKTFVDDHGGIPLPNGKVYVKDRGAYKETRPRAVDTEPSGD